ncbi:hypothetical protein [Peterkaempfera bronchialis]|uniref:Uncharacterized protein n=1 Tax=Peterkaempfera bronchialis TaxID=2126346 RepID=A0A345T4E6_9ACTN|nr:hypothetical protein [Peterkaempfera bronchialis]AXI80851.1 hypothetical protein C7M71_029215 [Peterkaempfera bronchialis]
MGAADDAEQSPIGAIGRVTVPIPPDGPGEVLLAVRGGTEAFAAWSETPIAKHVRVIVVDCTSARSVVVQPFPTP